MTDHLATAKGRAGAAPCWEGEQSPHLPPQMCEHVEKTKSKLESRTPVSPSQRGRIDHPDTLVTRCQSRISVENLGAKPQLSISKSLLQQRRAQRGRAPLGALALQPDGQGEQAVSSLSWQSRCHQRETALRPCHGGKGHRRCSRACPRGGQSSPPALKSPSTTRFAVGTTRIRSL